MTGLNLETFLHLLRADLGAWVSLGVVVFLLALMTWTSWGSRRALRKCLVLSVMLHLGLVLYGSTMPLFLPPGSTRPQQELADQGIRQIRVSPSAEGASKGANSSDGGTQRKGATWDRPKETLAMAEATVRPDRPEAEPPILLPPSEAEKPNPLADQNVAPDVNPPEPPGPEARPKTEVADQNPPRPPVAPGDLAQEIPEPVVAQPAETEPEKGMLPEGEQRLRPHRVAAAETKDATRHSAPQPVDLPAATPTPLERSTENSVALEPRKDALPTRPAPRSLAAIEPDASDASQTTPEYKPSSSGVALAVPGDTSLRERIRRSRERSTAPRPESGALAMSPSDRSPRTASSLGAELPVPDPNLRLRSRASRPGTGASSGGISSTLPGGIHGPIALTHVSPSGPSGLPGARGPVGNRPLEDVPAIYRSRLDPNRSLLAQRAGASAASEQAVARALAWFAQHQDADGRWNGGSTQSAVVGLEVEGRDSFTSHCPPGDVCSGECYYAEADTALTGLTLLAYLGAGYTHIEGRYKQTVGKGLQFLLFQQKPDGDLRGPSRAVGMYCHAMASLALCEAYALSGDERLRGPVERAVDFLVRSQATDGMAWRYAPREPTGDTSILGWVVLVLRSARFAGISVPSHTETGAAAWLERVSAGSAGGLARYQPAKPITPTMTAEAWLCRQLLGLAHPGVTSTEAADYLLAHGPDHDPFNLYYWYYGTLAMYQNGGPAWNRWNSQVRDQLVRRQRMGGHATGSWDPDDDELYGTRGGRLYSTALATLTLEVYYRYLRFYDEPATVPGPRFSPDRTGDPTLRRAGSQPPSRKRP